MLIRNHAQPAEQLRVGIITALDAPVSRVELAHLFYLLYDKDPGEDGKGGFRTFGANWGGKLDNEDKKVLLSYLKATGEWDDIKAGKGDGRRK